jgi:hypothetical protein
MPGLTERDYYDIKVYPARHYVIVQFYGNWSIDIQKLTYENRIASFVRLYAQEWVKWDERVKRKENEYAFSWKTRVLDIKGDG